jgi:Ca-activated chloride channel family protein
MELDEIKYLYLLYTTIGGVYFFSIYWKVKKQREFGDLELIKKLSPDRSVFKPFKLVEILVLRD